MQHPEPDDGVWPARVLRDLPVIRRPTTRGVGAIAYSSTNASTTTQTESTPSCRIPRWADPPSTVRRRRLESLDYPESVYSEASLPPIIATSGEKLPGQKRALSDE
jgi:hypothetical protein